MDNYTTTQEFWSQDVADTIYAITETLSSKYHATGVSLRECAIAEAVYTAHVKPLEDALTKAEAQNAATLAEHMANIIAQVGGAVAGEGGTVKMSMKCTCPYCNHISHSVEEATMHDVACEKHPAVIRAMKAEADRAVLVEALERTIHILGIINEKIREAVDSAGTYEEGIPRALTWTTEPPKVAGLYYQRWNWNGHWGDADVITVEQRSVDKIRKNADRQWAGPTPMPKEPS